MKATKHESYYAILCIGEDSYVPAVHATMKYYSLTKKKVLIDVLPTAVGAADKINGILNDLGYHGPGAAYVEHSRNPGFYDLILR